MRGWWWCRLVTAISCLLAAPALAQIPAGSLHGMLGANKPDLALQYVGTASSADGSAAARGVTVAMARKAIADARDVGFRYVRIMAAGYGPVAPPPAGAAGQNDLALWQSNPGLYWSRLDAMFDDLDAAGIRLVPSFVWNPLQFPALVNETVTDLVVDPASASRALLNRYLTQFITRYRTRPTILFYELTNELNLQADLNLVGRCLAVLPAPNCAAQGNFTTAQMTVFAGQMVRRVKTLDPSRPVGSGYSLPRAGAWHLAAQPEFSRSGPDWTQDTRAQFHEVLARTGEPFDLWSVHLYPGDVRWGNPAGSEAATLARAAAAARSRGKRLYLGEFGDSTVSHYLTMMLQRLGNGTVAYASIWVWEFYQQSTWQSANLTSPPPMSLEPGFTDAIDALLMHAAGGAGKQMPPAVRLVLTAPWPCATLAGPVDLYAVASATGPRPVGQVLFAVDGVPVGIATEVPFHVAYTPAGEGRHVVSATAYAGTASATAKAQVLVGATSTACRVP
jgi:hypothetical protein